MENVNLKLVSKGKKDGKQEVQGVIVQKMKGVFEFNYQTAKDPMPEELEFLKDFRNRFVEHLERLNFLLGEYKE